MSSFTSSAIWLEGTLITKYKYIIITDIKIIYINDIIIYEILKLLNNIKFKINYHYFSYSISVAFLSLFYELGFP